MEQFLVAWGQSFEGTTWRRWWWRRRRRRKRRLFFLNYLL
jgi:hypothetical protein